MKDASYTMFYLPYIYSTLGLYFTIISLHINIILVLKCFQVSFLWPVYTYLIVDLEIQFEIISKFQQYIAVPYLLTYSFFEVLIFLNCIK